jgi:two-component system NtrC family response regulator
VVAATNRDLRRDVEKGRFREDLYYRLRVVQIEVPPLRDRRDDIPLLVHHFLGKSATANGVPVKRVSEEAFNLLYQCHWAGNVRELENAIERAVIMCSGEEIGLQDLPDEIRHGRRESHSDESGREGGLEAPSIVDEGEFLPYLGLNQRQIKALNFIKKNGFITSKYYTQINSVTERHALRELKQMVQRELIRPVGKGRGLRYTVSTFSPPQQMDDKV